MKHNNNIEKVSEEELIEKNLISKIKNLKLI